MSLGPASSPVRLSAPSDIEACTPTPRKVLSPLSASKLQVRSYHQCSSPGAALENTSPLPNESKFFDPVAGDKRKWVEELQAHQVKAQKREAIEKLEGALLAAAPSATKVLEVLAGEHCKVTIANAIAKLAHAATKVKSGRHCDSICESLREDRVAKLWPSIQDRLEKQMRFNQGQSHQRLKLLVQLVPEEAPRQWLEGYDAEGQLKQLVMDTKTQLKFIADVQLGLGHIFHGLECKTLTFTYCKLSKKLVIQG